MSRFIEAIKQGIANAEDRDANRSEIFSVFQDANDAILEKTGCKNGFISITENMIRGNSVIKNMDIDFKMGYPVEIGTIIGNFTSENKEELVANICEIMETSTFGLYVRKLQK